MGANLCEKAFKLIFVLLNLVTATSPGVWHCTSGDDMFNLVVLL